MDEPIFVKLGMRGRTFRLQSPIVFFRLIGPQIACQEGQSCEKIVVKKSVRGITLKIIKENHNMNIVFGFFGNFRKLRRHSPKSESKQNSGWK